MVYCYQRLCSQNKSSCDSGSCKQNLPQIKIKKSCLLHVRKELKNASFQLNQTINTNGMLKFSGDV